MRPRSCAALVASLVAVAACGGHGADYTAEESELRRMPAAWAEAYNAGDADAIAAMYWDDATIQPPHAPASTGRAAIRDFFAEDIAEAKRDVRTIVIPEAGAVQVEGDLAWVSGIYNVMDAAGVAVDDGKYVNILEKREDQWLMIRGIWNSDRPPR